MGCLSVDGWVKNGKVRGRITEEGDLEVRCFGLTTQTRYYKQLFREFFRLNRDSVGDYLDINIIAKKEAAGLTSAETFAQLESLLKKIER